MDDQSTVSDDLLECRPVGAQLKQLQDRLLELGAALMRETDPEATALITKALDAVQQQRLSVSVIGQVSAGKTTLVNALARQPDLLPISQAPWTAVVTRLHFGLPGFPERSSHFQFFDESEWQRLAEHGGKLRELAERFLPGFNSDQLQDQVKVMRHRAQARLGPAFKDLLGSAHSYSSIQPGLIANYIAASPGATGTAEQPNRNYSDITRMADLFLELEPFGYPLTLIDTPGTNDPFLVREEMTLRCLDASDACIVVIDATKGVTSSDIGLLRILRGVNAQRLILFINKMDTLNEAPEQAQATINEIASTICYELGNSKIPVIVGSAQAAASLDPDMDVPAQSGLHELELALSTLVHHGHSAHYVHQAAATLMTLADGIRSQTATQVAKIETERQADKASFDDQVQRARSTAFSQDLCDQISRTTGEAIDNLHRISGVYEKQSIENLEQLIKSFAAAKKDEFLETYPDKLPTKTIRFDPTELRQQILLTHTRDYRHIRREMTNALRVTTARLMFLLKQVQRDVTVNLDIGAVSEDFVFPSQMPLGQTLAIDLDEPFWRRWWGQRVTSKEAANSLEALILQEFLPLVPDLVKLSKNEIDSEIEYSALQLSISGTNFIQSVKSEQLSLSTSTTPRAASAALDLTQDAPPHQQVSRPSRRPPGSLEALHHFNIAKGRHQRSGELVDQLSALTAACRKLLP